MPKVLSPPSLIELDHLYLDQAEHRLQQAISEVPAEHKDRAGELCYLVYEALHRGKFGNGSFEVAITCNEAEFVISVKGA